MTSREHPGLTAVSRPGGGGTQAALRALLEGRHITAQSALIKSLPRSGVCSNAAIVCCVALLFRHPEERSGAPARRPTLVCLYRRRPHGWPLTRLSHAPIGFSLLGWRCLHCMVHGSMSKASCFMPPCITPQ